MSASSFLYPRAVAAAAWSCAAVDADGAAADDVVDGGGTAGPPPPPLAPLAAIWVRNKIKRGKKHS